MNVLTESRRAIGLLLISVGAEMTVEADEFVPQDTWDGLFSEGYAEQAHPPHGEPYALLTAKGETELRILIPPSRAPLSQPTAREEA